MTIKHHDGAGPAHDPIGDVEQHIGDPLPDDHDPWGAEGDAETKAEEPDDDDTVPSA
jgi:hypothetical protein